MEVIFFWIVFCLVVGAVGGNREIGFGKAFFFSLFFSPILGLIVTLASTSDKRNEELALLRKIAEQGERNE